MLASGLLLALAACDGVATTPTTGTVDSDTDTPPTALLTVEVLDQDGEPVPEAWVMMGGWPEEDWALTDADGRATLTPVDAGWREQFLLAGKEGWFSGGTELDFDAAWPDPLTVTMRPLPTQDNPDYPFQPGGDGSSPDTSECGHCHWTIADDWAGSSHARAADSPQVWDLFTGAASPAADETACEALGGHWGEGAVPGEPETTTARCYTGQGVLPWLHDGCGSPGEPACDHPDSLPLLSAFGSCGDCHSPAVDGATPGQINLATATGVAREGVTCDLCHKVVDAVASPAPGLDGGLSLLRPTDPSPLPNLEYEALITGPYPDVIVPIMNGTFTPGMTSADWCGSCHEYAQPALHPAEAVDPERFPEGLPVFQTWSEFQASDLAEHMACRDCHMPVLAEQSSTYDITDQGLEPSVDQGWMRETGAVRHHTFDADSLSGTGLDLTLAVEGSTLTATVEVANLGAAHAVPTGEPLKHLLVRVSATDADGEALPATGGQVVPDVGGFQASGVVGETVEVDGSDLRFVDVDLPTDEGLRLRLVRPTGAWVDYPGPGTASFSADDLTPEDKGLAEEVFLGELAVSAIVGDTVSVDGELPVLEAGDRAYLVAEGDLAGAPGWLYAKVLVSAQGERGVAHYRAVDIASDNRIGPGQSDASTHSFAVDGDGTGVTVTATLVRRARSAPVAAAHGWETGDETGSEVSATYGE